MSSERGNRRPSPSPSRTNDPTQSAARSTSTSRRDPNRLATPSPYLGPGAGRAQNAQLDEQTRDFDALNEAFRTAKRATEAAKFSWKTSLQVFTASDAFQKAVEEEDRAAKKHEQAQANLKQLSAARKESEEQLDRMLYDHGMKRGDVVDGMLTVSKKTGAGPGTK